MYEKYPLFREKSKECWVFTNSHIRVFIFFTLHTWNYSLKAFSFSFFIVSFLNWVIGRHTHFYVLVLFWFSLDMLMLMLLPDLLLRQWQIRSRGFIGVNLSHKQICKEHVLIELGRYFLEKGGGVQEGWFLLYFYLISFCLLAIHMTVTSMRFHFELWMYGYITIYLVEFILRLRVTEMV